jgi:hypothetical protein
MGTVAVRCVFAEEIRALGLVKCVPVQMSWAMKLRVARVSRIAHLREQRRKLTISLQRLTDPQTSWETTNGEAVE